ncbi:probably inactive receptor-like protein kinase At2g46850 [Mangifera indica]|uniref:probably inactive receptor-like protein kinase At2g46850 n=1 Tax=Mangifera indica TaxID=29780 RepID=UPI001CFA44E8|nr:probably inactive receptor-like protein kinase At2g46850 [Mangifera indica]
MLSLYLTSFILLSLLHQLTISYSLQESQRQCQQMQFNETCGNFNISYPFYLNNSSSVSTAFKLSCLNSTTLYLNIDTQRYRVLEFFSDGLLVDFPDITSCRQYNDLNSFGFGRNENFAVSVDNVIGLYDCEDSSLCKADCETNNLPGCDGNSKGSLGCCYPLSDHSVWQVGDGFSVFSKFGCRGFSSWAVSRGTISGKRGVKLEWAIPGNKSEGVCASNAIVVNATAVEAAVRCSCQDGFEGDGFANGIGCIKSCIKDGQEGYGKDCFAERKSEKEVVIVAGVLAPAFIITSLFALFCLLKRSGKAGAFDHEQGHFHSTISFRKACRTRLFTYQELDVATKGFKDGQKLVEGTNGSVYAGVIRDGSHVAVHKVQCENERDLIQVLSQVEVLSAILHRNLARLLGCCIDSEYSPLVVYEYPANGTLEDHLRQNSEHKTGLDWYKRLIIAAETASVLAFLQYEIFPPIFHHELKSGYIFLDEDYSIKIAGFGLLSTGLEIGSNSCNNHEGLQSQQNDVYDFGVLLLEIITGSKHVDQPSVTLQKIRSGKLEEILDPTLYYHEQPIFRREQIEIVADLATRCLLFGRDGKIGMIDVAKELINVTKESIDGGSKRGPALEETFSNSSLLQMISMSPDSMHVP